MSTPDVIAPLPPSSDPGVSARSGDTKRIAVRTGENVPGANLRRTIILALIYALPACFVLLSVSGIYLEPDVWWHLRTAEEIIRKHAIPATESFSALGIGKPLVEYSWLFDLIVYGFYRALGLAGTVVYMGFMATAIGLVLHGAVRKRLGGFAGPIALTSVALTVLAQTDHVRPWLFTVLFFVIEMDILFGELVDRPGMQSRRTLWILPFLFALWANIHVQFVYGLAVLGLASVTQGRSLVRGRNGVHLATQYENPYRLWLVTGASFLATFLNPYTWRIYSVIWEYARDRAPYDLITELVAPKFRLAFDYILLVTVLAAAFVLGRARFRGALFAGILLLGTTIVSLHSLRDEWVALIVAVLIIATGCRRYAAPVVRVNAWQRAAAGILAALLIFVCAKRLEISNARLNTEVRAMFPVAATDFVLEHRMPGPLFNDFDFGGYLIWKLPNLPVSVDGRTDIYGGEHVERNMDTWKCKPGWKDDPDLQAANLIIGPVKAPLTYALKFEPEFHVVYEDTTAVVFTRKIPLRVSNGMPAPTTRHP